ncbi:unnamed protein product [Urochloa humidicola]
MYSTEGSWAHLNLRFKRGPVTPAFSTPLYGGLLTGDGVVDYCVRFTDSWFISFLVFTRIGVHEYVSGVRGRCWLGSCSTPSAKVILVMLRFIL